MIELFDSKPSKFWDENMDIYLTKIQASTEK